MSRTFSNVYRSLECEIIRRTDKAIQVKLEFEDGPADIQWIPISQCSSIHELGPEAGDVILMASEWILGQKKWLQYAGAAGYNPVTSAPVVTLAKAPQVPTTPPTKPWSEMDDDIPF